MCTQRHMKRGQWWQTFLSRTRLSSESCYTLTYIAVWYWKVSYLLYFVWYTRFIYIGNLKDSPHTGCVNAPVLLSDQFHFISAFGYLPIWFLFFFWLMWELVLVGDQYTCFGMSILGHTRVYQQHADDCIVFIKKSNKNYIAVMFDTVKRGY